MMLWILKLILAPVLIFQGKQAKKNTPRLPEAEGLRKGIQGNGEKQFSLLILGDSAAAGVGVDHQSNALSGQILVNFGSDYRVAWELIAKTGATTQKTIDYLESLPSKVFDIVVTSLGVNDVKAGLGTDIWLAQQKKLILLLRKKFKGQRFIISAVPPMELFPALPWPLKGYLGLRSAQMNRVLKAWLKEQADCDFMAFNLPMDASFMAEDGFHPNPRLHTIWGRKIFEIISRY